MRKTREGAFESVLDRAGLGGLLLDALLMIALGSSSKDPHHLLVNLLLLMRLLDLFLMEGFVVERASSSGLLTMLVDARLSYRKTVLINHPFNRLQV